MSVLEVVGPDTGNEWRDIKMSIKTLLGKIKSFTAVQALATHSLHTKGGGISLMKDYKT